jgi:quercetin dioxygenase-like cupin family protein
VVAVQTSTTLAALRFWQRLAAQTRAAVVVAVTEMDQTQKALLVALVVQVSWWFATALLKQENSMITHHFSDGLYAKQAVIPAGTAILKHTHDFSHLSILAFGKVAVLKGTEIDIVDAPAVIEIKAGLVHGVKAITDCVWFCIHATDEKDPSKVDDVLIGV